MTTLRNGDENPEGSQEGRVFILEKLMDWKFRRIHRLFFSVFALIPLTLILSFIVAYLQHGNAGPPAEQYSSAAIILTLFSPYALPISFGVTIGVVTPITLDGAITFTNDVGMVVGYWTTILILMGLLFWKRNVWVFLLVVGVFAVSSLRWWSVVDMLLSV